MSDEENVNETEESGDEPHDTTEDEGKEGSGDVGPTESIISSIPITDSNILKQLKEADDEACKTALIIDSMKRSILNLQKKPHLDETDAKILKEKQSTLMQKLEEFEKITFKVQELVGLKPDLESLEEYADRAAEFELEVEGIKDELSAMDAKKCRIPDIAVLDRIGEGGLGPGGRPFPACPITDKTLSMPTRHECLPKVIVCGSEQRVPRVIVCEPVKKLDNPRCYPRGCAELPDFMLTLTGRLSESYLMQEKLAKENATLEAQCGQLKQEVIGQDNAVDNLQKQIASLQAEMRLVTRENMVLNDRIEKINPQGKQGGACPPSANICPESNDPMTSQLVNLENEVKNMQSELMTIQRERMEVQQARNNLRGAFNEEEECHQPPCAPSSPTHPIKLIGSETNCPFKKFEGYCPPAPFPCEGSPDELLKLWLRCDNEMKRMQKELEKIEKERNKLKNESPSCTSPNGPPYECAKYQPPCPPPPPTPPPPPKIPCAPYYPKCVTPTSPCLPRLCGSTYEPGKPCKPNSCAPGLNIEQVTQRH